MNKLTYNPSNAVSVLLAAAFLAKYPEAEVKTTHAKGTDFLSKMTDEGFGNSYAVNLLQDPAVGELSNNFSHGIVGSYHDITSFDNLMVLQKAFLGNKDVINKIASEGKSIVTYKSSPAFSNHVDDFNASQLDEQENADIPAETAPDEDPVLNEKNGTDSDVSK